MPEKKIEEMEALVKEYALECNKMLLQKSSHAIDLYTEIWRCWPYGHKAISDIVRRLVQERELPEPVLSHWGQYIEEAQG